MRSRMSQGRTSAYLLLQPYALYPCFPVLYRCHCVSSPCLVACLFLSLFVCLLVWLVGCCVHVGLAMMIEGLID